MFLNIIYDYLMNYPKEFDMIVVGFDMVYKQNGDTFYKHVKGSKSRNDPLLKWGHEGLRKELEHRWTHFKNNDQVSIRNGSLQLDTSLPYLNKMYHFFSLITCTCHLKLI